MNLPDPSLTPACILAAISTVVGLFLTQGLIDNRTEKLVTGLAAVLVPLGIAGIHAIVTSRAHAAKLHAIALQNSARNG